MTLVTTRKFQLNTAIQWRAQDGCPAQPMDAVAKPGSHIGSEAVRYTVESNLILGFLSNDIEEVRFT